MNLKKSLSIGHCSIKKYLATTLLRMKARFNEPYNDPAFSRSKLMDFFFILLAMTFCELVIMFLPYHGIIGI
jgi:hypothetical protein